jgi:hypothetical protein
MEGILGILVLFADIYAILQIAQSSATTGTKAVWIVIVLLLPLIGVIAWYFAGPKS